ncbi:MAG: GNAT family N-acetyltransferase [Anaerolineae bacterium]|jgi:ribosomal protein S18 acetylase RimI-like enzyme|nr:GNAT family N-acetyltransferase [Anaerolineae bacterium]
MKRSSVPAIDGAGHQEPELVPLAWQHAGAAGHLLARAFHPYPAVTFLFPNERRRSLVLPHIWTAACRYSIRYGEAWAAPRFAGVTCWLPPGATHKTLPRELAGGMSALLVQLSPRELVGNIRNDLYADALHRRAVPGPHWYLFAIGVEPACQGQGIGGLLLRHGLARADHEGLPVYLETHRADNVAFYLKYGFEVAQEGRIPSSDVPVYAMVRRPAGTNRANC